MAMGLTAKLIEFENGTYRCGKCKMRQPLTHGEPPVYCVFCGSQFYNWENIMNEKWRLENYGDNDIIDNSNNNSANTVSN